MMTREQLKIIGIIKEFNLSQEEFALLFHCYQHQVSDWITGKRNPSRLRMIEVEEIYQQLKNDPSIIKKAREELAKRKESKI